MSVENDKVVDIEKKEIDEERERERDEGIDRKTLHKISRRLVEQYVAENNILVRHQVDSFNDCIANRLDQIVTGFNPIEINEQYMPDLGIYKHRVSINIENARLERPTITEKDGQHKIMMPNDARLRNLTYSSQLNADMTVTARVYNVDTREYQEDTRRLQSVTLGKVPIMVKSRYCNLVNGQQPIAEHDECIYDDGGYYVINGNEKVVIAQDRIAENKVFVCTNNKTTPYMHVAEVRSVSDRRFGIPKTTSVKLAIRGNQFGRSIKVSVHHMKHEIPLYILFRALGVRSDEMITKFIFPCVGNQHDPLVNELVCSMDEASDVMSQEDALAYLARFIYNNPYRAERPQDTRPPTKAATSKLDAVKNLLEHDLFPHIGTDPTLKVVFLGYMVKKLLRCFSGEWPLDDRDSYINKRIDTPGILMANLFRQYYAKMIKDMRSLVLKEIVNWPWRATNKLVNVITENNVYKLLKSSVIESGLKYGLATGNWGVKSSRQRQGVAQVLNRMTYMSTISHLRRVNTPIEKTGKLVQPRKLHPTQWGVICPSETPEGASVGLVKNLAMTTTVTTTTGTHHLRLLLLEWGLVSFQDVDEKKFSTMDPERVVDLLNDTYVFVNGIVVGTHRDPPSLYQALKRAKRCGRIHVHTGLVWLVFHNQIHICTEGGRCCRPLFIAGADGRSTRITKDLADKILSPLDSRPSWSRIVLGRWSECTDECSDGQDPDESIVEYMDVEESNSAMISMNFDLKPPEKAFESRVSRERELPIRYTHIELDPSMMLGAIAGSIPFSDHNQAPRNTYQCIWVEEPVLMGDGSLKRIGDVRVGDEVMTFSAGDLKVSKTIVIAHMTQETIKPMYRLTTESARTIVATGDHLFFTDRGWTRLDQVLFLGARVLVYDTETQFEVVSSVDLVDNVTISDITTASKNHSFIAGNGFGVHNSAMGKQAISVYASNFRHRFDTIGHVLNYPQRPLVNTHVASILHGNDLPSGMNAIVAIATFTGFNQEDSVVINQTSVQRGLFVSTVYKTYREQNNKNHSTGEEEFFCRPDDATTNLKPYNYSKLGPDGFVPQDTFVEAGDIIVGKCMPQKFGSTITNKDTSLVLKSNEEGFIDRNCYNDNYFTNVNNDGYVFGKVRVRQQRHPTVGDKFSSRSGQKGTMGMQYRQEDMPFTEDGLVPDVIMNPHAVPSRMTIAQLMECVLGIACCHYGAYGDSTPFTDLTVEAIGDLLKKAGLSRMGNRVMYNPRTGEQIMTTIFMGPTYYQRLKHMTNDKIHSRSSNGPVVLMTRQPAEGRARDGGLRLGEMEIECQWSHGMLHFLKERFMECSDNYRVFTCRSCGMIAICNPEKNIAVCRVCKNITSFAEIRIPYACKLLFQEIQTMCIGTKFITN